MIVEFAGLPRSGKSSVIEVARDYFLRSGLQLRMTGEAARTCPFGSDHRVEIACWTANQALNSVLAARFSLPREVLVLQDRGLFDALAFFRLLLDEGIIRTDTLAEFSSYFASTRWARLVDLVILFDVSPEVALERDMAARLSAGEGTITNRSTLPKLAEAYDWAAEHYSDVFPRIERVDTTSAERVKVARSVIRMIEDLFPR